MEATFSHKIYSDLLKLTEQRNCVADHNPLLGARRSFMGLDIIPNGAFPMTILCPACGGTGEGEESTYCPKCKGQGSNRYEGIMRNGAQTILVTGSMPKKFAPHFPRGAVSQPPISRGLG